MTDEERLQEEFEKLSEEYLRLKNKSKPFETEIEKEERADQSKKDRKEKWKEFESSGEDFEKRRDYVLKLTKEVETLKLRERKDELEQKLINQTFTEKELLELQALNNILLTKT